MQPSPWAQSAGNLSCTSLAQVVAIVAFFKCKTPMHNGGQLELCQLVIPSPATDAFSGHASYPQCVGGYLQRNCIGFSAPGCSHQARTEPAQKQRQLQH